MDCQTMDLVAYDLDLAGVDGNPDAQSQLGCSLATCQGASDRTTSAIEHSQHAVTGHLGDSTSELIDQIRQSVIVTGKKLRPSPITQPQCETCRVDDVGEHERDQHPLPKGLKRHEPGANPHPGDGHQSLIPDHPRIVAGRHVNDVAFRKVELGTVLRYDMRSTVQDEAHMSGLTPLGSNQWTNMGRPTPPGLMNVASHGDSTEIHDFRSEAFDFDHVVRRIKPFGVTIAHAQMVRLRISVERACELSKPPAGTQAPDHPGQTAFWHAFDVVGVAASSSTALALGRYGASRSTTRRSTCPVSFLWSTAPGTKSGEVRDRVVGSHQLLRQPGKGHAMGNEPLTPEQSAVRYLNESTLLSERLGSPESL